MAGQSRNRRAGTVQNDGFQEPRDKPGFLVPLCVLMVSVTSRIPFGAFGVLDITVRRVDEPTTQRDRRLVKKRQISSPSDQTLATEGGESPRGLADRRFA